MGLIANPPSGILSGSWEKQSYGGRNPRPPAQDFMAFRFDFSNISTLWKDTARTSAVTAADDAVRGVTNLGFRDEHLENAAAGRAPLWKPASGGLLFATDDVLEQTTIATGSSGTVSFAMLGFEHSGADSLAVLWEMGSFSAAGCILTVDTGAFTRFEANFGTSNDVSDNYPNPANRLSQIGFESGTDSKAWFNHEALPRDRSSVANHANIVSAVRIGANGGTGTQGWNGYIREFIIWDNYALTDADVVQLKAYDTFRHGTVWS